VIGDLPSSAITRSPNHEIAESHDHMRLQRLSVSLFGAVTVVSVVLAVATVWLFLTNPVTVANAVNEGDVSPLVRDLAQALVAALRGLLRYL
jgi:hypothetical protein